MRRNWFPLHLQRGLKEKISMEENTNGKKKTSPSIPANYISILQLQERWINEKQKKQKEEEEERRRKQQVVEEEKKIEEEDLKKAEEEKRLNRSNRKHRGRKNESMNGGEAKFVEEEKPEVTAAIGSGGAEDTAEGLPKDRGFRRKRYNSRKKKKEKNQDVDVVEDVVDCGCGSIAPPDYVVTEENVTPVKDVNRVYRKKGEKSATGNKSVATDDVMAIETQFEDLSIERGETKNLKAQTKSSNRNWPKQKQKLDSQRARMSIGAASTMVWVKKEQNERAGDGIASGVKPLNA